MKRASSPQQLSFKSTLKRIATGMDYFAVPVPSKTTEALNTRGPVPVSARVNDSEAFIASLYPIGGGRHQLRVRNKICKSVNITAGDAVHVHIQVRDRYAEIAIPKDLVSALRAASLMKEFNALPVGKKAYLLRLIKEAAKPETRAKRIHDAVHAAQQKKAALA